MPIPIAVPAGPPVGRKEDPGITKEPHPIAQPMDSPAEKTSRRIRLAFASCPDYSAQALRPALERGMCCSAYCLYSSLFMSMLVSPLMQKQCLPHISCLFSEKIEKRKNNS